MKGDAEAYIRRMARIDGWFWPAAAYLFVWLDSIQKRREIRGDIFEIGAYCGKSAILLAHLLRPDERLGVCDLFGLPAEAPAMRMTGDACVNGDGGFLGTFMSNFGEFFTSLAFLTVHRGRSTALSAADTGTCRFFHIDGGHEPSDVYGDLEIADRSLRPDGLVALDDFYNFAWPGVAEGSFRFMREHPGALAPLAIGFNKGILCRPAAHAMYRAHFAEPSDCWDVIPRGPFSLRSVEFCGVPTTVFHATSYRSPDPRRTLLTTLHQHRPRLADGVARFLKYHNN